jgi:hypothetical protein
MPDVIPEEMAHLLFLGFTVQQMGFFKEKACWTILLTAEKAEFFHWLSEEKQFMIPRSQASQAIYQGTHFMMVQRPSGRLYFFKVATANGEMVHDWMGGSTAKRGSGAFINNLYQLFYRPVFHLS